MNAGAVQRSPPRTSRASSRVCKVQRTPSPRRPQRQSPPRARRNEPATHMREAAPTDPRGQKQRRSQERRNPVEVRWTTSEQRAAVTSLRSRSPRRLPAPQHHVVAAAPNSPRPHRQDFARQAAKQARPSRAPARPSCAPQTPNRFSPDSPPRPSCAECTTTFRASCYKPTPMAAPSVPPTSLAHLKLSPRIAPGDVSPPRPVVAPPMPPPPRTPPTQPCAELRAPQSQPPPLSKEQAEADKQEAEADEQEQKSAPPPPPPLGLQLTPTPQVLSPPWLSPSVQYLAAWIVALRGFPHDPRLLASRQFLQQRLEYRGPAAPLIPLPAQQARSPLLESPNQAPAAPAPMPKSDFPWRKMQSERQRQRMATLQPIDSTKHPRCH